MQLYCNFFTCLRSGESCPSIISICCSAGWNEIYVICHLAQSTIYKVLTIFGRSCMTLIDSVFMVTNIFIYSWFQEGGTMVLDLVSVHP